MIEQAKGVLHAELGVSPEEAFGLLSRYSQNTNQRVRRIAAALVEGRITAAQLRAARPLQRRALVPLHQRLAALGELSSLPDRNLYRKAI